MSTRILFIEIQVFEKTRVGKSLFRAKCQPRTKPRDNTKTKPPTLKRSLPIKIYIITHIKTVLFFFILLITKERMKRPSDLSSMDDNIHNLHILSERILELGACVTLLIITFIGSLIGSNNSTICAILIVANTLYILFNMTVDHYWYIMKPFFTIWIFWLVYSVFWLQSDFPIEEESPPWTHVSLFKISNKIR